jgi:6-phosphofructokinase 1
LGGVAPVLAQTIKKELGYKFHYAIADYLQRSARHLASQTDLDQAYAVGEAAVEMAIDGKKSLMITIQRLSDSPYKWSIGSVDLSKVANNEKKMPKSFIKKSGYGITNSCRKYLAPLIEGEAYPNYENGLPRYTTLKNNLVPKRLKTKFVL